MLVNVPDTAGNYSAMIEATTPKTTPLIIANLTFDLRAADTDNASNGPNGRACVGGPTQAIDSVEFDNQFTCNCFDVQSNSPNCDLASPALAVTSENSHTGTEIAIGVAVSAVVLLLSLIHI